MSWRNATTFALGLTAWGLLASASAQDSKPLEPAAPPPQMRFNRLHTVEEVGAMLEGWAKAYPRHVKLETIGKSGLGRGMWALTIHNPATGSELEKPAMYIDANIHANEVQGTETALYIVDFVLKNYGKLPRVTELVDRSVLYFVPIVNPDGRAKWFAEPSTPNFPRTVVTPIDDDRDGVADEDGYDDLDGDGVITSMRKQVPMGEGDYRLDPQDPRIMIRVGPDEEGDWIRLGREGIDNDGDGRINEDQIGYTDPNRTWGFGWAPRYIQRGSGDYPLQIPETRSIAEWLLTKPNVAACQSFHNAGKMILRGPGAADYPAYPREDVRTYNLLHEVGGQLLPGYRKWIVHKDLYTVYGGTIDHLYMIHGAISFTNELYRANTDLDGDGSTTAEERYKWNDLLTLERQFSPYKKVQHPLYGEIEVGGFRQDTGRVPEMWMLEEECHRNAAFVLFHAHHLPKLEVGRVVQKQLDGGLVHLEIPVKNVRAISSMTAIARQNRLHARDRASLQGAEVVASGLMTNRWRGDVDLQVRNVAKLDVGGIPGQGERRLWFLVKPQGQVLTLVYESVKAGTVRHTIRLGE